jgi:phage tail tube protein FII
MVNNDEILLQAARAAAAKLPELEAKRKLLSIELQDLTTKINQYRNIAAVANVEISLSTESTSEAIHKRAAKGSCMADIDDSLGDKPMTIKEIAEAISKRIGIDYGFSTMHSNLKRGEEIGRYKNENGRWSKA